MNSSTTDEHFSFGTFKNLEDPLLYRQYQVLWNESLFKSPFTGPEFYRLLIEISINPLCFTYSQGDILRIAVFFKKNMNDTYVFLGDGFTDHNIITTHIDTNEEDVIKFLELVLLELKGNIYLKNITNWQFDRVAWAKAASNCMKKFELFNAWKNPMFVSDKNDPLHAEVFRKNFKKNRLTTYYNKLKKAPGFEFVIDKTTRNLDYWVEEFCMNHESRWNLTDTPSEYVSKNRRDLLSKRLLSFSKDNTLIRFSFILSGRVIGSVICLNCNNYLLYSLPSFSIVDDQTHASQALVCQIGQWAANNEYTTFDFGVGDEDYKLRFSNEVEDFARMYIPLSKYNSFHIKAMFEKKIRGTRLLRFVYEKYFISLIRHKLVTLLNKFIIKFEIFKINLKNDKLYLFTKLRFRFNNKVAIFRFMNDFVYLKENFKLVKISFYQYIDYVELDGPVTLHNRNILLHEVLKQNKMPYGLYKGDLLLSVAVVTKISNIFNYDNFVDDGKEYRVITDCYTIGKLRGKGYYPDLIGLLAQELMKKGFWVFIYAHILNHPSIKGIIKAGFKRIN